jgi:hypothetical protein
VKTLKSRFRSRAVKGDSPKIPIKHLAKKGVFRAEDGKPIRIEKWMAEQIWDPFCATDPADGGAMYDRLGWLYATGEGKTLQMAVLATYHCLFQCVDYPFVVNAAGKKEQAKNIFRYISDFIKRSPLLSDIFTIQRDRIIQKEPRRCPNKCGRTHGVAEIHVVASEGAVQHGQRRITLLNYDELWNQKDYTLISALKLRPRRVCKEGRTCFIGYPLCKDEVGAPLYDWVNMLLPDDDPRKDIEKYAGRRHERGWLVWRQSHLKDPVAAALATHQSSWWTAEDIQRDLTAMLPHEFRSMHCGQWTRGKEALFGDEWEETARQGLQYRAM